MGYAINPPDPSELHPTTYPVNRNIAPNPLGPEPQDGGFSGIREFGSVGKGGSREGAFKSEQVGPRGYVAVKHARHDTETAGRLCDGSLLDSAMPRTEQKVPPVGDETLSPAPAYWRQF